MNKHIADIVMGTRIREEMGDLTGLADSLAKYGLIHPVVVDEEGRLIAGGRRLEAAKRLGWTEIEVRILGDLSEIERRYIELEENVRRKDLTEYERSERIAGILRGIREAAVLGAAESVASKTDADANSSEILTTPPQGADSVSQADPASSANGKNSFHGVRENPGGRPPSHVVPIREIAERTGVSPQTLRDAEQHVKTVQDIPALRDQPKMAVIQAGRELKKIADPVEREEYKGALAEHPEIVQKTTKPDEVSEWRQKMNEEYQEDTKRIDEKYRRKKHLQTLLSAALDLGAENEMELQSVYVDVVDGARRSDLELKLERLRNVEFIAHGLVRRLEKHLNGGLEVVKR